MTNKKYFGTATVSWFNELWDSMSIKERKDLINCSNKDLFSDEDIPSSVAKNKAISIDEYHKKLLIKCALSC